ncbi:MAG: DUF4430 domain-containing protein [Oscillospiraceae bacterium]
MKKRGRKIAEYAVITLAIAAAAFFAVKCISLSPKEKTPPKESQESAGTISVELTIDFSTVYNDDNYTKLSEAHKTSSDLPEGGYYVKNETVTVDENSAVLDALIACCEQNDLPLFYQTAEQNAYHTAYVEGIGTLFEGDCTKASGWVYTVDGESPDVGMDAYQLSGGEKIDVTFVLF